MTEYVQTFKCPECGILASGHGHLCHPNSDLGPYTCEFCGKEVDDPRHVCTKMLDSMEYICRKCGRIAVYDTLLCEPELIAQD